MNHGLRFGRLTMRFASASPDPLAGRSGAQEAPGEHAGSGESADSGRQGARKEPAACGGSSHAVLPFRK